MAVLHGLVRYTPALDWARNNSQTHKITISRDHHIGFALAVGASALCGVMVLMMLLYMLMKMYGRGRLKNEESERILGGSSSKSSPATSSSSIHRTLSMKTIPFTVPPSPHPASPRRQGEPGTTRKLPESRAVSEDACSTPGSDPASPGPCRGSSESLSSSEFRGAHALGSLDPSLYKMADEDDDYDVPDNHIGRLWFAVEYERESEKLLVTLIKVKNLPSRAFGTVNACDPFARIYLLPDERRYLQSKFKKKTCHPKFEESFVFQVSNKALEERVLKLTIYDVDRHRRHNVIGHALYPLKEHNYDSNERVVMWRDLEREVIETTLERGEIHISLSYNSHLERLTVGIFEGRNFKKDGFASQDYYVKVNLLQQGKVLKTKKTEVAKKSQDIPAFNESFTFKLDSAALDVASVTITVMQNNTGVKDKPLGRVILGSFMFARGKELDHWNEMTASEREQVSHWHTLT